MVSRSERPGRTLILVCDSQKALFLLNEGDDVSPNLQTAKVLEAPQNPRTHDQGTDRPGRVWMGSHRSAVHSADLHRAAEEEFAAEVAKGLDELDRQEPIRAILLAAPPRFLAALRASFSKKIRDLICFEADKDLTKLPIHEIEQHFREFEARK